MGFPLFKPCKGDRRILDGHFCQFKDKRFHAYYVGIDIGYRFHEAACIPYSNFFDEQQTWRKAKTLKINADGYGISELLVHLATVSHDPEEFSIVLEPTGSFYGACLTKALEDAGYKVHFISNKTVKDFKETRLGIINKSDRIDSLVMAYISFQKALTPSTYGIELCIGPSTTQAAFRGLSADRWELQKQLQRRKNQLRGILAATHPELKYVFASGTTQATVLRLIRKFPTALGMVGMSEKELLKELVDINLLNRAKERSKKLRLLLEKPVVINYPQLVTRQQMIVSDIERIRANIEYVDRQAEDMVDCHPYKQILWSFPIRGYIWSCTLIGAIGDINRFSNYKKFKRYLGFTPDNKTSGTSINSSRLSHQGVRPTRRVLFQMAVAILSPRIKDNSFKIFYNGLLERHMPKKKALGHVAGKLAQVMYGCLKYNRLYDPDVHSKAMRIE